METQCRWIVGALWLALAVTAAGQESRSAEWFQDVRAALADGREFAALERLEARVLDAPADAAAWRELADVAVNVGRLARANAAVAAWRQLAPAAREPRLAAAALLARQGATDDALAELAPLLKALPSPGDDVLGWDYPAVATAAGLHLERGRRAEASRLFDLLIDDSKRAVVRAPWDLIALASAYEHVGVTDGSPAALKLAEKTLVGVQKTATDAEVQTAVGLQLGWLYLRRMYLQASAQEEFKRVLAARPELVDGWLGLLETWEAQGIGDPDHAPIRAYIHAHDTDPTRADAIVWFARRDLCDFRIEAARKALGVALTTNPHHKACLALMAAADLLAGDRTAYAARLAEIWAIDPMYGEAHGLIADVLCQRRRWPECVEQIDAGLVRDPTNTRLLDDAGRYALWLGQVARGSAFVGAADKADSFASQWRKNTLELLARIEKSYVAVESPHFTTRVHKDEAPVLTRVMLPFMERSSALLRQKYSYEPEGVAGEHGRMLIDVFQRHSLFSVRLLGFGGFGALGVCFGPMISMVGPKAGGIDLPYSWARTFHHEYAHTLTLGLSRGRVPRWLTEGLSTWEEQCFDPSWTRGMDRDLLDLQQGDGLFPVLDFDAAFGSPRVILAYYQAGLAAGWLATTFGMPKVREALVLYGEDRGTDDVFRRAFGITAAEFDTRFGAAMATRLATLRMQPRSTKGSLDKLEEAWRTKPGNDEDLVKLAWARFTTGKIADAEAALTEAGRRHLKDPRLLLLEGRLAASRSHVDIARKLLAEAGAAGLKDYDMACELAFLAQKAGRTDEAMSWWREAISCFPTDPGRINPPVSEIARALTPRLALAKMLRGAGQKDEAIAMLVEHLQSSPDDIATREELIEHYLAVDDDAHALPLAQMALLFDPLRTLNHATCAKLLLRASRFEEALDAARCALATKPEGAPAADAHVLAARALFGLGRDADARTELDSAVRLVPTHAEAQRLLLTPPAASRPGAPR